MRSFYRHTPESRRQHEEMEARRQQARLLVAEELRHKGIAAKLAAVSGVQFEYTGAPGTALPVVVVEDLRDRNDTSTNPHGKLVGRKYSLGAERIHENGSSLLQWAVMERRVDQEDLVILNRELVGPDDTLVISACAALVEPRTYTGQAIA